MKALLCSLLLILSLASCFHRPARPFKQEDINYGFRKESDNAMIHIASGIRIPLYIGDFSKATPTKKILSYAPRIHYAGYNDGFEMILTPAHQISPKQHALTQAMIGLTRMRSIESYYSSINNSLLEEFAAAKNLRTKRLGKHNGYEFTIGIANAHRQFININEQRLYGDSGDNLHVSAFFFKHKGYYITFIQFNMGGSQSNMRRHFFGTQNADELTVIEQSLQHYKP